jgi:hypothetical protein
VYDTNDWCDPIWWVTPPVDVTIRLSDYYRLTGVRWAAGQTLLPTNYQFFAACTTNNPPASGDWTAVTPAIIYPGGNRSTPVDFTAPFNGNWIKITVTGSGGNSWENSKWQVYGSPIIALQPGIVIMLR